MQKATHKSFKGLWLPSYLWNIDCVAELVTKGTFSTFLHSDSPHFSSSRFYKYSASANVGIKILNLYMIVWTFLFSSLCQSWRFLNNFRKRARMFERKKVLNVPFVLSFASSENLFRNRREALPLTTWLVAFCFTFCHQKVIKGNYVVYIWIPK